MFYGGSLFMAGEALTELAAAAVTEEVIEGISNNVEDVTKHFPFLKYVTVSLFFIGWGMYFIWFY